MKSKTLGILISFLFAAAASANPAKVIRHVQGVPNEYFVVLRTDVPSHAVAGVATSIASSYSVEIRRIWPQFLKGFLVYGPQANIQAMADDPRVRFVEQKIVAPMTPDISGTQSTWFNMQYQWHLDRLDELSYADRDATHNMCTEGRSAVAYVIDRGIFQHAEFETPSRVIQSLTFVNGANGQPDTTNGCTTNVPDPGATFASGHGTWVASVLAGTHIGAAKTQLVSLRIFPCESNLLDTADLIDAVEWIGTHADTTRPGVINHSGFTPIWDGQFWTFSDAVASVVAATQMPYFTSADNYSTNSCMFSPNHLAYTNVAKTGRYVFVVGGTSIGPNDEDHRYQYWEADGITPRIGGGSGSNGGECVSVYAPGVSIYVADRDGDYYRYDGTSFSAPAAAALAARYMEKEWYRTGVIPEYTQVYDFLLGQAQTPIPAQWSNTAPTYWMCIFPTSNGWIERTYRDRPVTCPSGYSGPWVFPYSTNTSNAKMLYWDEGACQ